AAALLFPSKVLADCECGYTVNGTLYTDLIESDFLHLEDIAQSGWIAQVYSAEAGEQPFGKDATAEQVIFNPLESRYDWAGEGINGGDAGVQIIVKGGTPEEGGLIPMGEITTNRTDVLHGSFRAGMKLTEIDMEFLSAQFNETSHPVNLVLQSEECTESGCNAEDVGAFELHALPYNPSEGFHEYRFDWFEDRVDFYADGVLLHTMTDGVPSAPGYLMLSQWSNGDPTWSAGPPEEDAVMTVNYVKAYFNSSDEQRQRDWENRCEDINAPNATCEVPEITSPPNNNASANTFFFSQQENMTVNQTVAGDNPNTVDNAAWSTRTSIHGLSTALMLSSLALLVEFWS
ncbi:MAG: hypothetical protein Q9183_004850, partial [Haloplaca sp. 2 TL-2023]